MSGHVITYRLEEKQRFWKRILIVDDDADVTVTFKAGIEENNNKDPNKRIEVYTSNDPVIVLSYFKPNFYDLLLADINMPHLTNLNSIDYVQSRHRPRRLIRLSGYFVLENSVLVNAHSCC
jgi:CheY-like chemotaxis protein